MLNNKKEKIVKNRQVAVLIPIYKKQLTDLENISLVQAIRILSAYDIYFFMPKSLSIDNSYEVQIQRFPDHYFNSICSYNCLMLSVEFYERFIDYEYILIYQLDAFVFSDKLQIFCCMGYDYIGAPWIDGSFYYKDSQHMIWYVGNGGLSLRRVDSFIKILKQCQNMLVNNKIAEDQFFSMMESNSFHVAPIHIALEFSFEMNVKECYEKNSSRLPFGCHAWYRFNLPFWKPWIEEYGYRIPEEVCRKGQEDNHYLIHTRRKEITQFWLNEYKIEDLKKQILLLFDGRNRKYVIWGAGYWGKILCRMMEDAGLTVQIFLDQQKELEGYKVLGHEVTVPERLQDSVLKYSIIVAVTSENKEIATILSNMGCQYRRNYIYLKDIDLLYKNVLI